MYEGPLPIYDHYNTTGHAATVEHFSIVEEGEGRNRAFPDQLKKPFSSESVTHFWIEKRQIPAAAHTGWDAGLLTRNQAQINGHITSWLLVT